MHCAVTAIVFSWFCIQLVWPILKGIDSGCLPAQHPSEYYGARAEAGAEQPAGAASASAAAGRLLTALDDVDPTSPAQHVLPAGLAMQVGPAHDARHSRVLQLVAQLWESE